MGFIKNLSVTVCLFVVSLFLASPSGAGGAVAEEVDYWETSPMNENLRRHLEQHRTARLEKVTDRVYSARGYDFANLMFVIGDDGIIVVDTFEFVENAQEALADLRKVTDKPVSAVVYSHGHGDHTGGVRAFIPEGSEQRIPIIASAKWERYQSEQVNALVPTFNRRATKQAAYQRLLNGKEHTIAVGRPRAVGKTKGYLPPTRTIDKPTEMVIDGVTMLFYPLHSELDDEMLVWLPEENVAYAADAVADLLVWFSTPRFEIGRDAAGFIRSANLIASWQPEHLVLGHGQEFHGRQEISRLLHNQADAVQTVIDQTIRCINEGMDMRETAARVKLPPHLAQDRYLGEHYHRLSWMVKGLYIKFAGWYGDDAVEMIRHAPGDEARRMIKLAGGRQELVRHAQSAYDSGDFPWAAQLATYLLKVEPQSADALKLKAASFRKMAETTPSGNERDYLLTEAQLLEDPRYLDASLPLVASSVSALVPTRDYVELFGPRLDLDRSAEIDLAVNLQIEDTDEAFFLHVRRGVLARDSGSVKSAEATIQLTRTVLYELASGSRSYDELVEDGSIQTAGSSAKAAMLFSLLD